MGTALRFRKSERVDDNPLTLCSMEPWSGASEPDVAIVLRKRAALEQVAVSRPIAASRDTSRLVGQNMSKVRTSCNFVRESVEELDATNSIQVN